MDKNDPKTLYPTAARETTSRWGRALKFFQRYGINVSGAICLIGCGAKLFFGEAIQSPREIAASALFGLSCLGMISDRLNLGLKASCLLGVSGHLTTLYPSLANMEPTAYVAMLSNAGLNGIAFFSDGLEGKCEKSPNRFIRNTLGKPHLFYGLGLMLATYLPGIINALRLNSPEPCNEPQLVLYGIFAVGAVSICLSKPKRAENEPLMVNASGLTNPRKSRPTECSL